MIDLRAARAKLERGVKHIEEFHAVEADFLAADPIAITIAYHPAFCRRIIAVEQQQQTPDDLYLSAGDAIHNLRTSLDIAIYAILSATEAKQAAISFPFGKDQDDFASAMARCQLNHASKPVREAIMDLQPWIGSPSWLPVLHRLDIQDKHKLPLTFAMTADLTGDDFTTLIGHPPADMRVRLQVGVRIQNGPPADAPDHVKEAFREEQVEGIHRAPVNPQFGTFFEGDDVLRSISCVNALAAMARAVLNAVNKLEVAIAQG